MEHMRGPVLGAFFRVVATWTLIILALAAMVFALAGDHVEDDGRRNPPWEDSK